MEKEARILLQASNICESQALLLVSLLWSVGNFRWKRRKSFFLLAGVLV